MRINLNYILFLGVLLCFSCGKDGGTEPDAPGVITITSPTTGIYLNGTILKVEGDMSDNNVLSQARVEIRNKSTSVVLFTQSTNTGNVGFYRFLWNWTITGISTTTVATVKVTAKDKLGNEVIKEIDVTLEN